jgi:hypothetical protein
VDIHGEGEAGGSGCRVAVSSQPQCAYLRNGRDRVPLQKMHTTHKGKSPQLQCEQPECSPPLLLEPDENTPGSWKVSRWTHAQQSMCDLKHFPPRLGLHTHVLGRNGSAQRRLSGFQHPQEPFHAPAWGRPTGLDWLWAPSLPGWRGQGQRSRRREDGAYSFSRFHLKKKLRVWRDSFLVERG